MKKLIYAFVLLLLPYGGSAQTSVGELLKSMPDSLMPLLTKNNRLDMIDFCEAKMKAEVTNRLEGLSEMTMLTPDSLTIRMSNVLHVSLYLQETREEYDSVRQVICMVKTFRLPMSGEKEEQVSYFSVKWVPLSVPSVLVPRSSRSTILREDDKLLKAPVLTGRDD